MFSCFSSCLKNKTKQNHLQHVWIFSFAALCIHGDFKSPSRLSNLYCISDGSRSVFWHKEGYIMLPVGMPNAQTRLEIVCHWQVIFHSKQSFSFKAIIFQVDVYTASHSICHNTYDDVVNIDWIIWIIESDWRMLGWSTIQIYNFYA